MSEMESASAGAPQAVGLPGLSGRSLRADPRVRYAGGIAALIALYYGAAHIGYALDFAGPVAAVVWLPVGVGISFLYLAGLQFWPGVVIGDLLVNNYAALPFGSALGQTTGNLLEVVAATLLLRRFARARAQSGAIGEVWHMLLAIALGTAISATIGTLSLLAGNVISGSSLPDVWRTWWLGDFSGALLVVPLAVASYRRLELRREHWRWLEAALALAAVAATSALAWSTSQPLTYIAFPALIWTAYRLGPRWATLAVAVAAGFAVWSTTHFIGPFHEHTLSRGVLETQLFIAVASLSTQCLAAVAYERERFARRLWSSRARLVRTAETERRRLERNLHDGAQQRLAGLMVRLELVAEAPDQAPRTEVALREAQSELAAAIDELRALAHGEHPTVLTEQGLAAAIVEIADRSPVPTQVLAVPGRRLPEVTEATAYYVIAEAMTNAQKYARASGTRVLAELSGDTLRVEVEDDGAGGAVETPGSGLQGLRDRVEAIGGTFDLRSPRGAGTRIRAELPSA